MKLAVLLLFAACDAGKKPTPAGGSGSAPAAIGSASASLADARSADGPSAIDGGAAPGVALPDVPCTTADIKRVRKDADALIKAGHADQAVAQLEAVQCWLEDDQADDLKEQVAWRTSDLAFAQYKAGLFEKCYDTAESQTEPYPHNVAEVFGQDSKLVQALQYNADLCHKAVENKRGPFVDATECFDGAEGRGIPQSVFGGKAPACLVIGGADKTRDGDRVCGKVFLKVKGQKTKQLALDAGDEANLLDPGTCCNISDVKFAARPHGFAVLVLSDGRNCDGGTASTSEEHVYEQDGKWLRIVSVLGAHYH